MENPIKRFKELVVHDVTIWEELLEKYPEKIVREASAKTACGCAICTKNMLEMGSPQYPIKGDFSCRKLMISLQEEQT